MDGRALRLFSAVRVFYRRCSHPPFGTPQMIRLHQWGSSAARALFRARSLFAAVLIFVGTTCRDATAPELRRAGRFASALLAMMPKADTLNVGETVKVTAGNKSGAPFTTPPVWTTSDANVATVVPLNMSTAR